jgi:WD40 repeat protein
MTSTFHYPAKSKKEFNFLHSPSFTNKSEIFNTPEGLLIEWGTTKGKVRRPSFTPVKVPSHTERSMGINFLRHSKNILTHVKTFGEHKNTVTSICSVNEMLWSGSKDRTIIVWSLMSDTKPTILKAHTGAITSLCSIPQHKLIASTSEDQHTKIWNVEDKRVVESFKVKNEIITCSVSKHNDLYCGTSGHHIIVLLFFSIDL